MRRSKENDKLIHIVYAGLFAALTALMTSVLHIPIGNGYIHCGDAVIFLAAAILPMPYAVGAAAMGGMLADVLAGYPMYALPTFIIKGILAVIFSMIGGTRLIEPRRIFSVILCGIISILGYWFTAVLLYGGWTAQFIETVPGNAMQAAGSGILYAITAAGLERVRNSRQNLVI